MMMSTIQAARSLEISTNTMREWALKGDTELCEGRHNYTD